jgi:hypothetical protein
MPRAQPVCHTEYSCEFVLPVIVAALPCADPLLGAASWKSAQSRVGCINNLDESYVRRQQLNEASMCSWTLLKFSSCLQGDQCNAKNYATGSSSMMQNVRIHNMVKTRSFDTLGLPHCAKMLHCEVPVLGTIFSTRTVIVPMLREGCKGFEHSNGSVLHCTSIANALQISHTTPSRSQTFSL